MDNYVELLGTVHSDLRVYRWRPRVPDDPCIWNWLSEGVVQQMDTGRIRDSLAITTYVVVKHTDADDEMIKLEEYVDAFRNTIDQELYAKAPLGAKWAQRQTMRFRAQTFNNVAYLSAEFPMVFQIDRMIFSA
jgi:hypothetical protein